MNGNRWLFQAGLVGGLLITALCGCYDPTADSIDAGAAEAKQESDVVAAATDVEVALDGDNFDLKWTGSNSVGMTPYGYFYDLQGLAIVDRESQALKHFEVTIAMDSVKALNEALTKKLKNNGFFEVDEYPESRFVATSISDQPREGDPDGTTHVVEGNFQLRDVTKSISFPVTVAVQDGVFTMTSEFKINRKDFGVVYDNATEDALIRDDVLLNIDIETPLE